MIEIKIPSPGESITEVEIANWLVSNGDYVEKDQEIAEIESDKATLPLVAEESGVIEIVASEGDTLQVGYVACKIDTNAKPSKPKEEPKKEKESEESNQKEEKTSDKKKAKETKEEEKTEERTEDKTREKQDIQQSNENIKVSPVAQKMMKEYDLSVDDVLRGLRRITRKDVEKAREGLSGKEGIEKDNRKEGFKNKISRESERKKMSRLRKKLSERLVSVKNETAMLTTFNEVDMSSVIALRKKYQKEFQEKHQIKLGFMSFFTKAVTVALEKYPDVNSYIENNEIVHPKYNDIGIAVQTDKGLMVPVIRNAETMTLAEIEHSIKELASKARNKKLSIDEMQGGTFSITNGGVFGSLLSTPILNPPQAGILGMHNIQERPVAINGEVEIRPMMYIALSYDHRIIDGRDSVGFLVAIKEMIEAPHKMLLGGKDSDKMLLDL